MHFDLVRTSPQPNKQLSWSLARIGIILGGKKKTEATWPETILTVQTHSLLPQCPVCTPITTLQRNLNSWMHESVIYSKIPKIQHNTLQIIWSWNYYSRNEWEGQVIKRKKEIILHEFVWDIDKGGKPSIVFLRYI